MSTRTSRIVLVAGALISLLPVILLALDTVSARSLSDAAGQLTGLLLALGIMAPPWVWLSARARSSETRGRQAVVLAAGTACALLAAVVYVRAYLRPTDAQSGISVLVVPFMQLVIILFAVIAEAFLVRAHPAESWQREQPAGSGNRQ